MEVPIPSIYLYIYKIKKVPRMATLNYRHFAAAARFALARITIRSYVVLQKEGRKALLFSIFFIYYTIARAGVSSTRVAKMPIIQGCHPRRFFFYFIYIFMNNIGTFMPIFMKKRIRGLTEKITRLYSFKASAHSFPVTIP